MHLLKWVLVYLCAFSYSFAQVTYVIDNRDPEFEAVGSWGIYTFGNPYNGDCVYKRKGDGSEYVRWKKALKFPGKYQVELYYPKGNFGESVPCRLRLKTGYDTVYVNQRYNEGWDTLGVFELTDTALLEIHDNFSGGGLFVVGDAVRLTYTGGTYKVAGKILFSDGNKKVTAELKIFLWGSSGSKPVASLVIPPEDRNFAVENLPSGYYKLSVTAWGYDSLVVDSLAIEDKDITDIELELHPLSLPRYNITGKVFMSDSNDVAIARVEVYPISHHLPVSYDSVRHGQEYLLDGLPAGEYRLIYRCDHYLTDSTTYKCVSIVDSDISLEPLVLYYYFKFAWITDSHVGAGFTESGLRNVISNLNKRADELDFVVHTGDIVEKGFNSEFDQYLSIISPCGLKFYHIPGNHDTKWSPTGLEGYKERFGDTKFSFVHCGFRFIGMNDCITLRGGGGFFCPADFAWLDSVLSATDSLNTPVLFFVHIPPEENAVFNSWRVIDKLKNWRTALILVGHGHSNKIYNFDGVQGVMSYDTYHEGNSGYAEVTVSQKGISITDYYTSGKVETWAHFPVPEKPLPAIAFMNLVDGQFVRSKYTIQIHTKEEMASGEFSITNSDYESEALSGSGKGWSFEIDPAFMESGYHVLTVVFTQSNGRKVSRSISFYTDRADDVDIVWTFDAGSEIITTPAVGENRVYFGTVSGKVFALDLATGELDWNYNYSKSGIFSSPTVVDSILLVGTAEGELIAFHSVTGEILWQYEAEGSILTPIVAEDGIAYFAAGSKFMALRLASKEKLWEYKFSLFAESKPVVTENLILFTAWNKKLHAIDKVSGESVWSWARTNSFYYAPAACWPVVSGQRVFVTDPERYLSAISLLDGSTIWSSNSPEVWESVGISEDRKRVFVRSLDGKLYAFSAASDQQKLVWKKDVGYGWDSTPSMPVDKDGTVYTGSKKGFVVSLSSRWGDLNWKIFLGDGYVTTVTPLDSQKVVAANLDGKVFLLKGKCTTGVDGEKRLLPEQSELKSVYPNPFNMTFTVEVSVARPQNVEILIYNLVGQIVKRERSDFPSPGVYRYRVEMRGNEGRLLPSGLYIVRVLGEDFNAVKKIVLMR